MSLIGEIFERLVGLVYPKHCPCCDEVTENNEPICEDCLEELLKFRLMNACKKCGMPKEECVCKKRVFLFQGITAPFKYEGAAGEGVLNIKKKKSIENAKFFCDYMVQSIRDNYSSVEFDIVTNVPIFKKDEKKRNFNHSKLIAKCISRKIGVEYLDTLKQIEKRKSQHELKAADRVKNVKGIYKPIVNVEGKTILLVDDIKTSGASLNECAHELLVAGADEVWCICAAITCKKTL